MIFSNNFNNFRYYKNLGLRNAREAFLFSEGRVLCRIGEVYTDELDDPYDQTRVPNILRIFSSFLGSSPT